MLAHPETLEHFSLGLMLGSGRLQRLLLLGQCLHNGDGYRVGGHAHQRVLESADAVFQEIERVRDDGVDITLGHCHDCQSNIFASVYR